MELAGCVRLLVSPLPSVCRTRARIIILQCPACCRLFSVSRRLHAKKYRVLRYVYVSTRTGTVRYCTVRLGRAVSPGSVHVDPTHTHTKIQIQILATHLANGGKESRSPNHPLPFPLSGAHRVEYVPAIAISQVRAIERERERSPAYDWLLRGWGLEGSGL